MPRNVLPKDKLQAVNEYLNGEGSQESIAKKYGVNYKSFAAWINNYKAVGDSAFFKTGHNKVYSTEFKEIVVISYFSGEGSYEELALKYKIPSKSTVRQWILKYNGHEELKASGKGGATIMTQGRKTTFDERVEIVQHCIAHDHSYAETSKKYQISYQQARNYTVKYETDGVDGLQDRRGKRKSETEMTEVERLRAENRILKAEKEHAEMEASFLKKTCRNREEAGLSLIRHEQIYQAIQEEHDKHNYPIDSLCKLGEVSRSAYYKWLNREIPANEIENQRIAEKIEEIHQESPDKGYRRIRDDLDRYHDIDVNDKRVLRICRKLDIKSTIKYANTGCTRHASNPQYISENFLHREFTADAPNEKWLTDVTEFKYYIGIEVHKVYLSAILDLYDRRIVSFAIGDSNNNSLVFDTFDAAVTANPDAHPLFHSDRGYQYTSRTFHGKLEKAGMTQSMSRVAKCIDNGPMEGFWGILKRKRYYGKRFKDRESLVKMIESYIDYYNNKRLQRNLGVLTPMEKHENYLQVA